jgi:hypothetical protein
VNFVPAFVFFVVSFSFHHKAHKVVFTKGAKKMAHGTHGLNGFCTEYLCELRAAFVFFVVFISSSPQRAQSN